MGPRVALSGQPLPPVLPEVAAALAAGRVGPEHVAIVRGSCATIPAAVSADERVRAEREPVLAKLAAPGMRNPADEHPCTY